MTWNLQPLQVSGNTPLTTHQGRDPVEIYGEVSKRETWKLVTLGKGYSPENSSILDPGAASQTWGSQPKSDSEETKSCPLPVKKKSFLGSQLRYFLQRYFFFPLPDTLWAPRWIQGDTARDTGSGGDKTALPAGGDNSSLLELWQFLLVLNPQELLELITSHSQSIYSCCLPLFVLHIQHAPDPLIDAVSRTYINFTVSSASQFSSLLKVLDHPCLLLEQEPVHTLPEWVRTQEDKEDPILCW